MFAKLAIQCINSRMAISFRIEKEIPGALGRAGVISTPHGDILTPAFIPVATRAAMKAMTVDQLAATGAPAALANTYHLYLAPGAEIVKKAGGLHRFMNWPRPLMTDSGGFQVFSLGAAWGQGISKISNGDGDEVVIGNKPLTKITAAGATFVSSIDGSTHELTPEKSMAIQHDLGADIIFAFDECTAPTAGYDYQVEALARTGVWAERSLLAHQRLAAGAEVAPTLFGIVQGGRFRDLRERSARQIAALNFPGYGIGGSFTKEDISTAVGWVTALLPSGKPRHLLGIGEPADLLDAVAAGADTFDCVLPTRLARHGTLLTTAGRLNILNARYREDFSPPMSDCVCATCGAYSRAYLAHLFRSGEILGPILASIHNVHFLIHWLESMRRAIVSGQWRDFYARNKPVL